MLISNIINDSFGLISKQLKFYCWNFRRNLDHRQRQELIELLYEQHFERLANKIKNLNQSANTECRQQVSKLLFEQCLTKHRRHQLVQLVESGLVDINVRLDNYGRTLLHRSAYNLDVDLVKLLIEHGVNIKLRDYAGNTALHIAIQSYRNGAVIFGSGNDVVQNLSSIIRVLLDADKSLQNEQSKRKRCKLMSDLDNRRAISPAHTDESHRASSLSHQHTSNSYISTMQYPFNESCANTHSQSSSGRKSNEIDSSSHNTTKSQSVINESNDNSANQFSRQAKQPADVNQDYAKQQSEDGSVYSSASDNHLLEEASCSLIDTKNAFGRTALHYCVLVVGEQHLAHFVQMLLSYGAETDMTDTRMRTPLYCLVKRPSVSALRQKCQAISCLIESGCDDLGLAIPAKPSDLFSDELIKKLEQNLTHIMQSQKMSTSIEPIFNQDTFKRVPSLKHLVRLRIIKNNDLRAKLKRQVKITLPSIAPTSLNTYMNRKILDQSELF